MHTFYTSSTNFYKNADNLNSKQSKLFKTYSERMTKNAVSNNSDDIRSFYLK